MNREHARRMHILAEIHEERLRQIKKFGDQSHLPDGTGGAVREKIAGYAKDRCDHALRTGKLSYLHILEEEVCEAFAESDPRALETELIQVAAVALAWVEKLRDHRAAWAQVTIPTGSIPTEWTEPNCNTISRTEFVDGRSDTTGVICEVP